MKPLRFAASVFAILILLTGTVQAETTLHIATVNNADMTIMQGLSQRFEEENPDIYHHPRNRFVAGFIGSPNMNFVETEIQKAEAEAVTVGLPGGGVVSVPVKGESRQAGDKVTLGVRPEHLLEGGGGDGQIAGKVLVVKRLGGGTLIYAKLTDNQTISAQIDGNSSIRVGDTINLGVRSETCHIFTADGLALPQIERHPLADMSRGSPVLH